MSEGIPQTSDSKLEKKDEIAQLQVAAAYFDSTVQYKIHKYEASFADPDNGKAFGEMKGELGKLDMMLDGLKESDSPLIKDVLSLYESLKVSIDQNPAEMEKTQKGWTYFVVPKFWEFIGMMKASKYLTSKE